jgi:hypothetical protein
MGLLEKRVAALESTLKDRDARVAHLEDYIKTVESKNFVTKLVSPGIIEKFSLLAEFMEKEKRLRGLKYLPAMFE